MYREAGDILINRYNSNVEQKWTMVGNWQLKMSVRSIKTKLKQKMLSQVSKHIITVNGETMVEQFKQVTCECIRKYQLHSGFMNFHVILKSRRIHLINKDHLWFYLLHAIPGSRLQVPSDEFFIWIVHRPNHRIGTLIKWNRNRRTLACIGDGGYFIQRDYFDNSCIPILKGFW